MWKNFSIIVSLWICLLLETPVTSVRIHYIHWNSSSPIFRDAGSSHVIEIRGGRRDQPWDYEQANIICPFYRANDVTSHNETERYIVYNVTKEEFESCRLHNSVDGDVNQTPRIVAVCNNPFSPNYFTLTFRPFSPTPGAFEFHPGKDYFFISTSSVKNLHQRSGGKCRTHNMRLVFRIKDVDLKDNFQSVENVNVAQPRNDDDYSEEDESENEDDVQYVKDSEKAFPVLSKANAATRAVNVSFNILIFILSIYLQKLVYFRPKFD